MEFLCTLATLHMNSSGHKKRPKNLLFGIYFIIGQICTEKVSFDIASEASYVYILRGQKVH